MIPRTAPPSATTRRWSIRAQLVALALAVAVPAAGLVTYALVAASNVAREAAYAQVENLAVTAASHLDLVVRDSGALLAQLAKRPRVRALDPRDCDPLIENLVSLSPQYTTLAVRDREGNAVCSFLGKPLGASRVARFPWFAEGVRSETLVVGDAFFGQQTSRWVSVITHPVRDDDGRITGLLALPLDLRSLQDRLFETLPEGSLVAVLDRRNHYLMRSIDPDRWVGKPLPGPQAQRATGRRSGETFETTGVDGVTRMYAVAVVPTSGWRIFAALPKDVVFAPHRELLVRSAAIGFAVLVVVIALAYAAGTAIARPIGELARAAAGISGGERRPVPATDGAAEVEAVASELNRLVDERDRHRGERAALVADYERLLKSARDIYILVSESGRVADFNDAAVEAYGYGADELRGMPLLELRAPGSRETYDRDWREADKPGGGLFETIHQRKDGSCFPVEVSARSIVIDGTVYRQAFVRDISVRKGNEEVLHRQNAELDRFNRAAVGRELDVIELKRKVNALARELGREPPYPLAFLDPAQDEGGGAPQP